LLCNNDTSYNLIQLTQEEELNMHILAPEFIKPQSIRHDQFLLNYN
jgi:hypothetical protein